MLILTPNQIKLCCRQGSCPIVEKISDEEFTIVDDYAGKVRITKEQMTILKNTIEHFEKQSAL
jgi:hypothetical protein